LVEKPPPVSSTEHPSKTPSSSNHRSGGMGEDPVVQLLSGSSSWDHRHGEGKRSRGETPTSLLYVLEEFDGGDDAAGRKMLRFPFRALSLEM